MVRGGARWCAYHNRVVVDVETEGDALVERHHRLLSAVDSTVVHGGARWCTVVCGGVHTFTKWLWMSRQKVMRWWNVAIGSLVL